MLTIQMEHLFNTGGKELSSPRRSAMCEFLWGFYLFLFKGPDPSYFVIKFSDAFPTNQQD